MGMQFDIDKSVLNVIRGATWSGVYDMENDQNIEAMGTVEIYKNLGVKQVRKIEHQTMNKALTTMFTKIVVQVLKTHLNIQNMFKDLNT